MEYTEQTQNNQLDSFLFPNAGETYENKISSSDDWDITGVKYRASGNLLICNEITKSVIEPNSRKGIRGVVSGFSIHSARRMRRYLRECTSEYKQMVTLTYPEEYPTDGAKCKEHLRRFLQEMQREFNRSTEKAFRHSSFWFLEFQRRGAPHFHIFTNWAPDKSWVSIKWYDIVQSGDDDHYKAGTRVEFLRSGRQGTISYASKYAAKLAQKQAPPGFENIGRWWGVYGARNTMSADIFVSRRQFKQQKVKKMVRLLDLLLETLIFEKKAKVLKRVEGFLLVALMDKATEDEIRRRVNLISISCCKDTDMFEDAEVDYGACY